MARNDIALIDLDGTIADLDKAVKHELELLRSPGEPTFEHREEQPGWYLARRKLIMSMPGFWRNLERLELGFQIVEMLEAHGFTLQVLTKGPSSKPLAWGEKLEWCRTHLPQASVTVTEDKSGVWGKCLCDDWPPYFMGWLANRPRGLVIVPAQPWNVDAEILHPNIIRFDGTNVVALNKAILAAKNRKGKEALEI